MAIAGLWAIDRSFVTASRMQARFAATETAEVMRSVIFLHMSALQAVEALYISSGVITANEFHAVVTAQQRYASGFRRIWLVDNQGYVQHQQLFGDSVPPMPEGMVIDTVQRLELSRLVRQVRSSKRPAISRPGLLFSEEAGFLILVPLFVDDSLVGIAGGSVTTVGVSHFLQLRQDARGRRIAVIAEGGAILHSDIDRGARMPPPDVVENLVLPDGSTWRIEVVHTISDRRDRVFLWSMGLLTLFGLGLALLHERRQAMRLAERSLELERLSGDLLRANRAKSEFLANVSHELRTPLNAIVGFVDLLRDGVYGELVGRQQAPVERIASSAGHLRHLVDQVLDIAKIAAGRLEIQLDAVDLRSFVSDVAAETESLLAERGLTLTIAVPASMPKVRTDIAHLRQIVINLIGNAVKFTTEGGITIRARHARVPTDIPDAQPPNMAAVTGVSNTAAPLGGWVAIQVTDTGIGIAPEQHVRIFDEFEQVNAGSRGDSMQRGTGLGLSISKRLSRLLGGDLTVQSAVGQGSTFTIWLPMESYGTFSPSERDRVTREDLIRKT